MHHNRGTLVSGRADASAKFAMTDPVGERSKSLASAEPEGAAWSGFETRSSACVVGASAGERGSSCEIEGAVASSSRLSFLAVIPLA